MVDGGTSGCETGPFRDGYLTGVDGGVPFGG